jgi:hypothetical protein
MTAAMTKRHELEMAGGLERLAQMRRRGRFSQERRSNVQIADKAFVFARLGLRISFYPSEMIYKKYSLNSD